MPKYVKRRKSSEPSKLSSSRFQTPSAIRDTPAWQAFTEDILKHNLPKGTTVEIEFAPETMEELRKTIKYTLPGIKSLVVAFLKQHAISYARIRTGMYKRAGVIEIDGGEPLPKKGNNGNVVHSP